jgi:16S rRNA pseudouridine516 synthase
MKVFIKERLDKVLSNLGFGSRSDVKKIINKGIVKVNNSIVKDPSQKISLSDQLIVYDEILIRKEHYYFMMNKAPDCITATEDPKEKTVMDYLKGRHAYMNLFPVGRLDKETEGLLILTTDGKFAHLYTSPKHLINKEYYVEVKGLLSEEDVLAFKNGIVLDDGYQTLPGTLTILLSGEISQAKIVIREGKYRQIRRSIQSLGKEVIYLKREKMGSITLDKHLELGSYRELTDDEIASL